MQRSISLSRVLSVTWMMFSIPSFLQAQTVQLHWYRGNTHTHTINSDGDSAPGTVARWYREHGYQFLFITDHEYLSDAELFGSSLRAKIDETAFLVVITEQGEKRNQT